MCENACQIMLPTFYPNALSQMYTDWMRYIRRYYRPDVHPPHSHTHSVRWPIWFKKQKVKTQLAYRKRKTVFIVCSMFYVIPRDKEDKLLFELSLGLPIFNEGLIGHLSQSFIRPSI